MPITVSTCGTAYSASTTAISSIASHVANSGDHIIVCTASRNLLSDITASQGGIAFIQDAFAGLTNLSVAVWHGVVTSSYNTTQAISISNTNSTTKVLSWMRVTGLREDSSYNSQGIREQSQALYNGADTRHGERFNNFPPCTINSVSIPIGSIFTPSGTGYVRIRSVSDDAIIGTLGSFNLATLTYGSISNYYTFDTPVVISTSQDIRLLLEFEAGDSVNYFYTNRSITDRAASGIRTIYNGVYTDDATTDQGWLNLKISTSEHPIDQVSYSWGVGTAPDSNTTAATAQDAEILVAAIGSIQSSTGAVGSWAGDVTENTQRDGATNVILDSAASVVSSVDTYNAAKTGLDSVNWAAVVASYYADFDVYENTVTESLSLSDFTDSYLTNFGPEQLALSDSASVDVEGVNPTSLFAVRIAFVSNPFDNLPVWVDVTENLMSFHIRRGRQWELNRLEAGTAVVRLKNISGDYWPNNTSSPLYPNVLPWKRINIRALYNGLTYDLYTGYIEAWEPSFLLRPIKAPVMDLTCSDGIKNLSQYLLNNTTGYSQEISGTRIDNVLTSLGWPSTARTIDAGQSLIQSTGALAAVNAMTHIFTVEDTELGIFYESPSGSMIFQDRHKRLKAPYTTSQSSFGDTATTFGYTGVDLSFEDLRIYNDIRVTPLSGTTEQVATSTTSQDIYGPRSLQRPSLLMVSDAEALAQAQYLLSRYATPVMRCRKIEIRPNADADNLYPCVLGYDLSTRVTIKLTQATIDKDYHIEGIFHDWDVLDAAGLKTTWMLSDAETEQFWILEDPVWGVLGSTTKPAW